MIYFWKECRKFASVLFDNSISRVTEPYILLYVCLPIVALLIIENVIVTSEAQIPQAEKITETLSMNVSANPDLVSVGDITKLLLIVTNNGNSNATITSIELSQPWNVTNLPIQEEFIPIQPDRTTLKSIQLRIPGNISSGTYDIAIKISSQLKDYHIHTLVDVKRIESLPLSDNIPLSILVLIFSGILTYSIAAYIMGQKFQRSYVEIGLWSGGLGFLNWGILYLFAPMLNMRVTLELIQYDFYSVAGILAIGTFVGAGAGLFYKFVIFRIKEKLEKYYEKYQILGEQKKSLRKGFWRSGTKGLIWPEFALDQLEFIKEKLGRTYSITVKVYLKSPINGTSILTGILKSFEDMGTPYDIVIYPKYITNLSSQQIIDALRAKFPDGNNIISFKFSNDEEYKEKVRRYLKLKGLTEYDLSIEITSILERLLTTNRQNLFEKVLGAIDFSLYVNFVIRKIQPTLRTRYDGPIFIQGDNIMNVEVIKYETIHAVRLQDFNNKIFPKVYNKSEFPLIQDVTAD